MNLQNHIAAIEEFYKDQAAARSGVPYINHIYEGIDILTCIDASDFAKSAYCLHPIFQADEALLDFYKEGNKGKAVITKHNIPIETIILAMEYRRMANSYLSFDKPEDLIKSPIVDVWDMLRADKIQNRKDFEAHHKGKHKRSNELTEYFNNWMGILNITEEKYQGCCMMLAGKDDHTDYLGYLDDCYNEEKAMKDGLEEPEVLDTAQKLPEPCLFQNVVSKDIEALKKDFLAGL